ncbi:NADH-quinone oxidoreductase subunit G [Amycolatopsis sp. K13G38]|uniref:NADH-quinone oxidoreductase subunit G n=1 Tax=Amycolatopsis acididurans TaxID=2724524 RepID=A0ABX1J7J3_9PSEU|nr:NADH-quinone oxidoreductase subunit G [Amycolatopsis acididurans]NKQ55723.1 NADH-quinone oxidoreductase subunit G [Amycolatopsis acididurans]
MTMAPEEPKVEVPEGHVKLTIDGEEVIAPKGELLIRTAERLGTVIPRFCDHPLLDPAGACRQCLVEVEMGGRPMPKPQASCTMTVADGMVVKTQLTSPVADKAQQGVMELLLINHPLDCPICDKGGECPLQNQAMAHGRADSRFVDTKRTFPKPLPISTQVLLDRERCVLCQRCTRFSAQIAGDPFIDLLERGWHQQIGTAETADVIGGAARSRRDAGAGAQEDRLGAGAPQDADMASKTSSGKPFESYFSGNTIQICPVGALTSAQYRFRSRPFDLVSSPSVCEHCSSGCAERTDFRRGKVMRKLAGNDPDVNEEWICDKGRFAFRYAQAEDRIRRPLVRSESGELEESSWTEALRVAAAGLAAARDNGGVGVLAGGRLTTEDAYAYAKFARVALHTNDIDFRARAHSDEELSFLASRVVGVGPEDGVTFAALEHAPTVLCVAFEPEDEAPIVFLRLRKAARKRGTKVVHLGQWTTTSVRKTFGELLACAPGGEPAALAGLAQHAGDLHAALSAEGAVILVGERAAEVPGLFSAVDALSAQTGARVAWISRRAGERGALEAGAAPALLPGGRPVADAAARAEIEKAWGVSIPATPGRDTAGIVTALANGWLSGAVVGGVDPLDLPDPALAVEALKKASFVVSLELRPSAVTEHADVVLPIAPDVEKAGSYVNWEGRRREFDTTIENTGALSDCRVLDTLAVEMDADLFTQTPAAAYGELSRLGTASARASFTAVPAGSVNGETRLSTWRQLLDKGSLQVDEPHLAGTARKVVARVSPGMAEKLGETVTVSTDRGAITVPVEAADLPEGVVWLPANSDGSTVRATLGAGHGAVVSIRGGAE